MYIISTSYHTTQSLPPGCRRTHLGAHGTAVADKCGEMLTVEVRQVVRELLVQERLAAIRHHLLWGWNQAVFVVVDPDASPCRHFDLRNALSADSGFPQNSIAVGLRNQLLEEAAAASQYHVLILR